LDSQTPAHPVPLGLKRLGRGEDTFNENRQTGLLSAEPNVVPTEVGLHGHGVPGHAAVFAGDIGKFERRHHFLRLGLDPAD
jgi:hypothetical protein